MTNFSDSYCEIKADLPRDFEIYREILKANLWDFSVRFFFSLTVQHFQVFSEAFTVAKTNDNCVWTSVIEHSEILFLQDT